MRRMQFGVRVLGLVFVWLAFATAQAATITVNSILDSVTPNDGNVTLREAITAIMAGNDLGDPDITAQNPAAVNAFGTSDTINFNIAGAGVHTLTPASTYPNITKPVTINGYTQGVATPNSLAVGDNAVLLIEIDGTGIPANNSLFQFLGSGGSTVRGLVINRVHGPSFNIGFSVDSINNTIAGNFVGTNPTGTLYQGTNSNGIEIRGTGNVIGGTAPADRNVITAGACCNGGTILITGGGGNTIRGNYIGVNAAGTAALQPGTATDAIELLAAPGNVIGGSAAGAGNVILGTNLGIRLGAGASNNTVVQGNFIGTNATGTAGLGGGNGISTDNGASNNTIGGSAAGAGNLISGGGNGIFLADGASNYTIQGNKIGTDITGTLAIPNSNNGIVATTPALGTIIGGTAAGAGNVVAFNGGHGVNIASKSYPILGNSIFSNAGLGITLQSTSPLPNDVGDADTGANNFQNYPVLSTVSANGGNVLISGSLNSTANTTFRLEFFSNAVCDVSGNGEGQTFLGSSNVTTDGSGNASFNNLSFPAAGGNVITSTATLTPAGGGAVLPSMAVQPLGLAVPAFSDTSEFSACLAVVSPADLTISKTHTGNFAQGQVGATYTITVTNLGAGATTGTVTVSDTVPAGLTPTAVSGTGWSCGIAAQVVSCTRSDVLAASASYPAITLTVNVAGTAPASVTNTATVSGGGENNAANDSSSDTTTITAVVADLTIVKSHSGNFTQGQVGATYTITVTNSGAGATTGTVTVSDTVPAGLTPTAASGTGWSCGIAAQVVTCTRSDVLTGSASYPAITLTVNVAGNAPASVTNTATVSGGGETNTANDSASDVTTINAAAVADLTITKTHSGNFTQGQVGATYTITVTNSGAGATTGTVTVSDTVPAGLTPTAASGTGWSCGIAAQVVTCTRSDVLAASASYPAITLTVNVAGTAPASVINTATVSGGGETNTANDSSSDNTTITAVVADLTIVKSHSGNFAQGQVGATYTITVTNSGAGATTGTVTVSDTVPAGLTPTAASGTGWSCGIAAQVVTCTRSDALAASASYPAITLTVTVAGTAPASVTNTATVSGGGETNTANDSSSDATTVFGVSAPVAIIPTQSESMLLLMSALLALLGVCALKRRGRG